MPMRLAYLAELLPNLPCKQVRLRTRTWLHGIAEESQLD